jgi:NAD+ kinase
MSDHADSGRPRIEAVALTCKRTEADIGAVVQGVNDVLTAHGCQVLPDMEAAKRLKRRGEGRARRSLTDRVDLVVSLGGDGNMLSVARRFAPTRTPIIGVNIGRLGFLAEVEPAEFERFFEAYLAGECPIEDRMMLDVDLDGVDKDALALPLLNDVVITKAALARMVDFDLLVDDGFVSSYRADGLIISTPTGSTAYSLAAGGPIVTPLMDAIVITPICPQALSQRPLIVPAEARITVRLEEKHDDLYLSLDGQVGLPLAPGAELRVTRSELTARMVRDPKSSFYDLLRRKLRWGGGGS